MATETALAGWSVGVDLGATKTACGLVSPLGQIVARSLLATCSAQGLNSVVARLSQAVQGLMWEIPAGEELCGVGVCCPGPIDHEHGLIIDPPNLIGLQHTNLRLALADAIHLPVTLEHDAKAAALGEFHHGAGRHANSMVYIVVGTGVGAAIVRDGALVRGEHNSAGEVGHIRYDRHGDVCSCGSRGCTETFLSGPRLVARYSRLQEEIGCAGTEELDSLTGEQVVALARDGDTMAALVVREAGEALGVAVATMAMILDIDLFVIGGGVAQAGDLLLGPARDTVPTCCYQSVGERVSIVSSDLGVDAPILGCASLVNDFMVRQRAQ